MRPEKRVVSGWAALRGVVRATSILRRGGAGQPPAVAAGRSLFEQRQLGRDKAVLVVVILVSGLCSTIPFELLNKSDRPAVVAPSACPLR